MIKSFRHKGLKKLFEIGDRRGVLTDLAPRIRRMLDALDATNDLKDLNLPSFDLHELKGDRKGIYAMKVNKNWRITFRFIKGEAHDVDLEDYH